MEPRTALSWGIQEAGGREQNRASPRVPQAGWREGVKEEIPNLLIYHVKAHSVLTQDVAEMLTPAV